METVTRDATAPGGAEPSEPRLVRLDQPPAPGGTVTRRVELAGETIGLVGDQVTAAGWSWWWSAVVDGRTVSDRGLLSERCAVEDLVRRWRAGDWPAPELLPLTLRRSAHRVAEAGTVVKDAYLGDRWVGWVGDHRKWKGSRYGARQWWACWRENDDDGARWHQAGFATRDAACAALGEQVATGGAR